jgi:lipopolysaccharide transport system ATP-binding protein
VSDRDVAIRAERLGKQYRLGRLERYPTLRDALAGAVKRPFAARSTSEGADTLWALRNVAFDVRRGEVLGVIGHNGAGKSTLLKILSRIAEPTTGRAVLRGRIGSLLEVGTGFHPELTGRENVYLNGAILGMRRAEIARQFDQIVAFAEVERFIDTPVKHFSSGMYMRLAFAVAAHLEPEILIVDEVLAVGDAAFQRKCLGRMEDVAHAGRTVLFVSHNLDAVRRLCTRCLLLQHGRTEALGETSAVIAQYLARDAREGGPEDWIDLAGVHRAGSGEARFAAVRYSSRNPEYAGHPYPGGALAFELAIDAQVEATVDSMAVNLSSPSGTRLVNADIISLGEVLRLRPGRNRVRLELEALHLAPGVYACGLWLGPSLGRPIDHIESGFSVEVVDATGPGFGTSVSGLVPCRFRFTTVHEPS